MNIYYIAQWTLAENKSQGDGLPSYLRVAIVLKRRNDDKFQADIKVSASADMGYTFNSLFRQIAGRLRIDPVFFDPKTPHFGPKLDGIDHDNLSQTAEAINNLCAVRATTVITTVTET